MADDGIYRKTEKGRTEVATRANKLGLRERTLLIMVDDKTTRGDLLSKNTHPGAGAILDALLAQGFIETDPGALPAGAGQNAAASMPDPAPAAAQAPQVEVSLISASRFACNALVTYLGPSADDLTALVEQATGAAELATVLDKCRHIIQDLAGKRKADEFWRAELSAPACAGA
ncbi:MAG: hypothetical protein IPI44_16515 [Sulfuritalea sp.]|nr:hypothetical protein [Sulfuritalea sp.]